VSVASLTIPTYPTSKTKHQVRELNKLLKETWITDWIARKFEMVASGSLPC